MIWHDVVPHLSGLANLATSSPTGDPHVSVVMPLIDGDTLWIFARADSGKAMRIGANGRVALMWRPGPEAYVYGTAELVHDLDVKRALWARTDLPFDPASFFGTVENPDHVMIRITPNRAVVMVHGATGPQRLSWHAAT